MVTLKDYEQLIKEEVQKISDADPNWDFSVVCITEHRVWINWTYLLYLQETDNCFFINLHRPIEDEEAFITCRTPQDDMIDGYFVVEADDTIPHWVNTYESAIKECITKIAEYAHNVY